jgi:hypothetical protein
MNRSSLIRLHLLLLPELVLALALAGFIYTRRSLGDSAVLYAAIAISVYIIIKVIITVIFHARVYSKINGIISLIGDLKKGKFPAPVNHETDSSDPFAAILRELSVMGKHMENIVSTQKTEISNLRELYNSIVLSISSYFIVLNEKEEIIFANESFCKKFQFELEDIVGAKIDSIFIFLTTTIRESMKTVLRQGEAVVLEKTHLVSTNRISIIADIKLSTMAVKGQTQIIFVIDDVTAICKKDFQINLISQVSESIQRDDQIDSVLHAILIGVTSGSGLGFNRAILLLTDQREKTLKGKMAVGPDTMEEAIQIWSSVSECGVDIYSQLKSYNDKDPKGRRLLEKVLDSSYNMKDTGNIFVRACLSQEHIHVFDADHDERMTDEVRQFMEVREFVITPLVSVNKSLGVIIADNKFNQTPIGTDNIELLSIFAFQAALLIESYNNLHLIKKEMEKIRDRQEAMVESEKLAAVGRIASHIAHEIRNPLVTMGGYARRILQLAKEPPKNSDNISKAAAVVLKESERLEKTLSNVMDFSKSTSFIMEFNNLNEVVADTYELLKNLFQERRIMVHLNLDREIPLVKSDFNQMKQVVLNLFQNAIDATPAEGSVTVKTMAEGSNILLSIRDSGSGISEEEMPRIFEPFFTTKVTGVGLGLSIIKKIVTDHNGEITVTSRKDEGTEFVIKLPVPR